MNFEITGKKIVSTQPEKKVSTKLRGELKTKSLNAIVQRKDPYPINRNKTMIKVQHINEQLEK